MTPRPFINITFGKINSETLASKSKFLKLYWSMNMVLGDTLSRRIYSVIDIIFLKGNKESNKAENRFFPFSASAI